MMFVLVAAGIVGWWLFVRHLMAKPWEKTQSTSDDEYGGAALAFAPARIGLWLFLAVVTSFFGLFLSAYGIRMDLGDWRPLAEPNLLWLNTVLLVLSSAAFQLTRGVARRGDVTGMKTGLLTAGVLAFAFLVGQFAAWRELEASGQYMSSNSANAFFYLLTGLHGIHLLGGLYVWGRTTSRVWRGGAALPDVRLSIQLCSIYWHYLLLVWLVLFGLLMLT